jgi:penicillin amidase
MAWRKWLKVVGLLLLGAVGGALVFVWWQLRGSLPRSEGRVEVSGLSAAVTIERDALGVPRIRAANALDAAAALGYLHAQDRYFQMDLQRRRAAGELSELFGAAAVDYDRGNRRYRFRNQAEAVVARTSPEERATLEAYTEGVHAGLADLSTPPWEYLVLGAEPKPWSPTDTVLVSLGMYLELQGNDHQIEIARSTLDHTLAPELVTFLWPSGTEWDAPLLGEAFGPPTIPPAELVDPRRQIPAAKVVRGPERSPLGSNNMAISGARTASGLPMLAGDMHLGLAVPALWYRVEQRIEASGRRLVGPSLPGTPQIVAGSNGEIAWAFTNGYGDWSDLVVVEEVEGGYRTPDGVEPFQTYREQIGVAGAEAVEETVRWTRWGPIVATDPDGRPLARKWVALEAEGANLGIQRLLDAGSVAGAIELAPQLGIPAQNLVVVDRAGSLGWTVLSAIPRRVGFDGTRPRSWAEGEIGWDGWVGTERPRVVDPTDGRLWTANARTVGSEGLAILGDGGYDLGARARQIRDGLGTLEQATAEDLLAVQLDDRAVFLARWQALLVQLLEEDVDRAELRQLVESWGGRAAIDSVGYRLVRAFRSEVETRLYSWLTSPALVRDSAFDWRRIDQREGALWQLVSRRPEHFLPPDATSWEQFLLACLDGAVAELTKDQQPLSAATWGRRNTTRIRHPLSGALPLGARWLDFPARSLPGDWNMPRVQSPTFGASQRMVITPGREEEGIFQLPGGQSAHPQSAFFRAGLDAWQEGQATPLLAGPTVDSVVLEPQ